MRLGDPAKRARFVPLNRLLTEEEHESLGLINVAEHSESLSLSIFAGCEAPAMNYMRAYIDSSLVPL